MDVSRVLVLGDSLTKGVVYSEEKKRYHTSKNGFIAELSKKLKLTVTNASKFGTTLIQGLNAAKSKVEKTDPDVVLIEYGGNDCDFDWEAVAGNPKFNHRPHTELEQFESRLGEFVCEIKDRQKTPVLLNLPPLDAPRYFKWFTGGDEQKGARVLEWLGDVGRIYWGHERYSRAIERVAKLTNTHIIDIRSAFLQEEDFRSYMCIDGIHPNESGQNLIMMTILSYITSNAGYMLI